MKGVITLFMMLYMTYVVHGQPLVYDGAEARELRSDRDLQTAVTGYTMSSHNLQCISSLKNTGKTTAGLSLTACANSCNTLSTCSGFSYIKSWLYGNKCILFTVPIHGTSYTPGYNCYTKVTTTSPPTTPKDRDDHHNK
jgi:hypothetical protein